MIFDRFFAGTTARGQPGKMRNAVTMESVGLLPGRSYDGTPENSMRLADVSRCIEVLSNDMAKLPWYLFDQNSKERSYGGELMRLLRIRPNDAMSPFTLSYMTEVNVLCHGNGYIWIVRDGATLRPKELIPVPAQLVQPQRRADGSVWYRLQNPITGEQFALDGQDMIHLKGCTRDGLSGISVLSRAREIVGAGLSAQEYQRSFYDSGGQPSGVLQTDSDLTGTAQVRSVDGSVVDKPLRDIVREEWERVHSGAGNAHRVAVLDYGLKYTPINISQSDAQFVETRVQSRVDIANFFGVPLYKLNDGKQAYSSNEQQAVDYAVSTLQPIATQWEQEFSFKLLRDSELADGKWLRLNMMAALRGDSASRAAWYKTMREIGCYSVNDILDLEDEPAVEGGDTRYASLNHVPLEDFKRLSETRNGGDR